MPQIKQIAFISRKKPNSSLPSNFNINLSFVGNINIIEQPFLSLFCSSKCPDSLILKAYNLSLALQEVGTPLASGFLSPVEQDALKISLRGEQKILVCPARGLNGMRIPVVYRMHLESGQLLLASIFPSQLKRPTVEMAYERNRFVGALAEKVLVIHANPGGKLAALC